MTSINFREEETVMHYTVEGSHPFRYGNYVWLEDAEGNRYEDLFQVRVGEDDVYSFEKTFPAFHADDELWIGTLDMDAPTIYDDMEIIIPLEK